MNGADSLCDTLLVNDIDVCFANPGTSEMHFVAALDRKPRMRCVLGLFEGVVTGAADGYARMADKPAATLLHLGPGLGNGLANLHNARRARTPMVNVVGDHATYHVQYDAPLTSDGEAVARPMSHWVGRIEDAASVAARTGEAIRAARQAPGNVATLFLPANAAWTDLPENTPAPSPVAVEGPSRPDGDAIRAAAAAIRSGEKTMLLLGGTALRGRALAAAGRIAQATGVRLASETSNRRIERGLGRTPVDRLPYPVDQALAFLADVRNLVLVGARSPVAFFAYPGKPSLLAPEGCHAVTLATQEQDLAHALEWLAEELGIKSDAPQLAAAGWREPLPTSGKLTSAAINQITMRHLPENAILVDESITQGREIGLHNVNAAPHDWLQLTGGAIGIGLPMATGAAVACPDRKVVTMQADGSGMYTVQALWTQARERLDCLTIIYANNSYQTLHGEMRNVGVQEPGRNAQRMLDLVDPSLDWVSLARGMGVEAVRVDSVEGFTQALQAGLKHKGPFLIEAAI
ncbi:acetolactate synthase large subunit [Bordetella hinzii]|uniref:Acetolactate synthase large subunit n=3 Tax=Bordetella hinzii TaxID=103855 RepID=A0AAN1VE34_9BORD|nr:acetolactate synthase large subunit [Bordetella hinzii]AKQ54879.1 Putative acetolactate synthase large subunit IlvX [Bordetella hinzii]AKQ59392.1 Putative acetolactate synthase large subunit IlvX [Bordetella hinzii]AZW15374.1 acetolactate synthase large subunit [Bordetella hinzii]KCB24878.1 thiamine pyrophosphate enzyme, N-terminal TPP binding domain protein [Bordetella hinzii OH87 BAL007II]KCB27135.1 thiamine pyrophosphate enzyme, N-terminal TPP binding domain protein [Bordetella hinzii CA